MVNSFRNIRNADSKSSYRSQESNKSLAYQIVWLMENSWYDGRYVEVYRDALDDVVQNDVLLIDRDRLHNMLADVSVISNDSNRLYRQFYDRARSSYDSSDNLVPPGAVVWLIRQFISIALDEYQKPLSVVLTGFFDFDLLCTITDTLRLDAIVRLSCGGVCRLRDKFVTAATKAKRSAIDVEIQTFWQRLDKELGSTRSEIADRFKHTVFMTYKSNYNARLEPPDPDQIVDISRKYVLREMATVFEQLFHVRSDYEKYSRTVTTIYVSSAVETDESRLFEVYRRTYQRSRLCPEEAVDVSVVLAAMIKALETPEQDRPDDTNDVDDYGDSLSAMLIPKRLRYPLCVPYGNRYGSVIKRHDLTAIRDLFDDAVKMLSNKWAQTLWPSNITARQIGGCAVNLTLCVLALNRLRTNLDVFRGEVMYDLSSVVVSANHAVLMRPNFVEPLGRLTMAQILEKASERYSKVCYVYFQPEDVMLVAFYDFEKFAPTRKCSTEITIHSDPIYLKDYYDYVHGRRLPQHHYNMSANECVSYKEHTVEVCFRYGDGLTVLKRNWRFHEEIVMFIYKCASFTMVSHVMNNILDFRFTMEELTQIYVNRIVESGCLAMTCTGLNGTSVDIEFSQDDISSPIIRLNYPIDETNTYGVMVARRRLYYAKHVKLITVEYVDGTTMIYSANGTFVRRRHSMDASSTTKKSLELREENASSVEYSDGGLQQTVKYADGTEIVTYMAEIMQDDDWILLDVISYKFRHGKYQILVSDPRSRRVSLAVGGVIVEAADGGACTLRLDKQSRVEISSESVVIIPAVGKPKSFYWEQRSDDLLFYFQDSYQTVKVHNALKKYDCEYYAKKPLDMGSDVEYYVVKRNMSGYRVPTTDQYERFKQQVLSKKHSVIQENSSRVVMLFGEDDAEKEPNALTSMRYDWFDVISADASLIKSIPNVPLVSRIFHKLNADYDGAIRALQQQTPQIDVQTQRHTLDFRSTVTNVAEVKSMYAGGNKFWDDPDGGNYVKYLLNSIVNTSFKRAVRKSVQKNLREARMHLKQKTFIPYYRRCYYEPFKNHQNSGSPSSKVASVGSEALSCARIPKNLMNDYWLIENGQFLKYTFPPGNPCQ